ncbi:MAG TPA: type II CRISPR-associated endonuclease Cas1, partial [Kiritimatiellae bacterium]|nr:type II CRISPR-associated endonuclease Cas1 [Kiritimatiellia bacterium]
MTDRVLDIAEGPARLRVRNNQLVLERDRAVLASIPLEEVAVVLVSTPAASYSHAVLCGLGAHNGVLVVCDDHCMPVAMCMPLAGHSLHAERLRLQVSSSLPLRKRVWQQIVKAKIRMQSRVLHAATGSDAGLEALGRRVKSGDPNNLEGQASRRYWPRLFGQGTFRRDPGSSEPPNNLLNYSYAVVRAVVARAVVGA